MVFVVGQFRLAGRQEVLSRRLVGRQLGLV
jgi:hypothetical protein